jgi:DNA-directed RNA polymerase subunit M/transcription elongation factor TFIIS
MTDSTRTPALADTDRPCPTCGTLFVPHPRKPSQIYCCERCRATAWRRRRALRPVTSFPATSNDEANEVRNDADTANADANEVTGVQRCPHCRQPIVLVTLITTPAAAHVTVPAPPATRITSGGYPNHAGRSAAAPTREGP